MFKNTQKNIVLVISLLASIFLIKLMPQPYGKVALAVTAVTFYFNFIKDERKAKKWFLTGINVSGMVLIVGYLFFGYALSKKKIFVEKTPVKFEETSFEQSLLKAKSEGKFVFIDFYASWCPPCIAFAKNILTDAEVGSKMNASFVNIKYDAETGEGKTVAKKYDVKAYPALMILNSDGIVLETVADENVPSKAEMIALAEKYKK